MADIKRRVSYQQQFKLHTASQRKKQRALNRAKKMFSTKSGRNALWQNEVTRSKKENIYFTAIGILNKPYLKHVRLTENYFFKNPEKEVALARTINFAKKVKENNVPNIEFSKDLGRVIYSPYRLRQMLAQDKITVQEFSQMLNDWKEYSEYAHDIENGKEYYKYGS